MRALNGLTNLGRYLTSRGGHSRRTALILGAVALAVLLIALSSGLFWWWGLDREEAGHDREAMIRVLRSPVELRSQDDGLWAEVGDLSPLRPGARIRVGSEGLAVVQLFEGSAIRMEPGSDLQLVRSQEMGAKGEEQWDTFITANLKQGRIAAKVAKLASPGSSFLLQGPSSVGAVQGTLFELEVLADGQTSWRVSEGEVRIVAIIVTEEKKVVAAAVKAQAGISMTVPSLPPELRDESVARSLIQVSADLAQRIVTEKKPEVKVKGTQVVAVNTETGNAVYDLSKVVKGAPVPTPTLSPEPTPAPGDTPRPTATLLPPTPTTVPGKVPIVDDILVRLVPSLTIWSEPAVSVPSIPDLPTPKEWLPTTAPTPKPSSPNYFFTIYGIVRPMGVAVDAQRDRLYVTGGAGERDLQVFTLRGVPVASLSPPGTTSLNRSPVYVAVDYSGKVYVSDRRRHTIDIWNSEGEYMGLFAPARVWSPLGLSFGSNGNLYVTEVSPGLHRVMVFNQQGTLQREFGIEGEGPGQFSFPNQVIPSVDGTRLFVSDSNNARVQVFSSQGEFQATVGGGSGAGALGIPRGLAMDQEGRLFVVDTLDHDIHVYQVGSTVEAFFSFGGPGVGDGEFNYPNDISSDGRGRFYITDTRNNRVQVWGY